MPRIQLTIAKREVAESNDPMVVELNGEDLQLQDQISGFVLMELVAAGAEGAKSNAASAAFISFYKDVLTPESYERFRDMAIENKWNADDLMPFVTQTIEFVSARPTMPPPSSPPGGVSTSILSTDTSSFEG